MDWRNATSTKWTRWWKPKRRNRTNNSFCSLSTQYVCVCVFVCNLITWIFVCFLRVAILFSITNRFHSAECSIFIHAHVCVCVLNFWSLCCLRCWAYMIFMTYFVYTTLRARPRLMSKSTGHCESVFLMFAFLGNIFGRVCACALTWMRPTFFALLFEHTTKLKFHSQPLEDFVRYRVESFNVTHLLDHHLWFCCQKNGV